MGWEILVRSSSQYRLYNNNKKVLLHDNKRCTARWVASLALVSRGTPCPARHVWGGGGFPLSGLGYCIGRAWDRTFGTPGKDLWPETAVPQKEHGTRGGVPPFRYELTNKLKILPSFALHVWTVTIIVDFVALTVKTYPRGNLMQTETTTTSKERNVLSTADYTRIGIGPAPSHFQALEEI